MSSAILWFANRYNYDWEGAIKEGYTHRDIIDYLSTRESDNPDIGNSQWIFCKSGEKAPSSVLRLSYIEEVKIGLKRAKKKKKGNLKDHWQEDDGYEDILLYNAGTKEEDMIQDEHGRPITDEDGKQIRED